MPPVASGQEARELAQGRALREYVEHYDNPARPH